MLFRSNSEAVDFLIEKFNLALIEPENKIIRQGEYVENISIIVCGFAKVFKYYDSRNRIQLGLLGDGIFIGSECMIFDSPP